MVLHLRKNAPNWDDANCLGDWSYHFDEEAKNCGYSYPQVALDICNGWAEGYDECSTRHECLIWALKNNEAYGIFGGMTEEDRHKLRRFTPEEDWKWHEPSEPVLRGQPSPEVSSLI